jgi:hypothetical protein
MTRVVGAKVSYHSDGAGIEAVLRRFYDHALEQFDERFDRLLVEFNERLLARTPVWSGDMIHNWRWSTRSPNSEHADPIEEPFFAGRTSKLPIGDEPRRRANITRARQSLAGALRSKTPVDIYLTNTAEHAMEIEAGVIHTRAQPGFLRLTLKEVFGGYA